MEVGLGEYKEKNIDVDFYVLILVLMEVGLGEDSYGTKFEDLEGS